MLVLILPTMIQRHVVDDDDIKEEKGTMRNVRKSEPVHNKVGSELIASVTILTGETRLRSRLLKGWAEKCMKSKFINTHSSTVGWNCSLGTGIPCACFAFASDSLGNVSSPKVKLPTLLGELLQVRDPQF